MSDKRQILMLVLLLCVGAAQMLAQEPGRAIISADQQTLTLAGRALLQPERDGFMSLREVRYAPTRKYFVVLGCGYECTDNVLFLFRTDGSNKRKLTAPWDFVLEDKLEWSADGQRLFYYRINSTGAEPPKGAPAEGWVEVDVRTGNKRPASARVLPTTASYAVFNAADGLAVRAAPGVAAKELGRLPRDAKDVKVLGASRKLGRSLWVQIQWRELSGWVNQAFLYRLAP